MLNVTRPPANYRRALGAFKQAFRDERNFSSFVHMACALIIVQAEWTVTNFSDRLSRPDEKARRTYNRFFTTAAWDQTALAQAMLSYVWSRLAIDDNETLLLIIDDTFSRKFADATDGVGNFRNGSTGDIEDGNVIVTSCLQYGDLYVPFQPVLYLGEDEAELLNKQFQTKLELAVEKIVEQLQPPAGAAVTVVADSAYYSKETVRDILKQGYDVVCRLKSDKHVTSLNGVGPYCVRDYVDDSELSFREVTITVRETEKTYRLADDIVVLDGLNREIKLVVTENEGGHRRYYMSTDLDQSAVEILECGEDRWNIETFHQQATEKFGLKSYELESKDGIERFLQLVCVAWTLVVLEEVGKEHALWADNAKIGDRIDRAVTAFGIETLLEFSEEVGSPLPKAERRQIARQYVV
jgi:SRSO17 transposase